MKLRIKDDFGEKFEVEEITDDILEEENTETIDDDDFVEEEEYVQDEGETLSSDEISALKRLAGVVDKLLALIPADEEIHDDEEEIDMDETITDDDEEIAEEEEITDADEIEEEEEVVDTNPIADSFGSVAKKVRKRDSVDKDSEISNAWNNQYAKFDKNR